MAKIRSRETFARPAPVSASGYRPFTRLEQGGPATTDEFDREGMGIAAKE
jgi:hypothetical protein